MQLTEILRCPTTGGRLRFESREKTLFVEHLNAAYPLIDGIVDFCPHAHDRVSTSYDKVAWRYDPYITGSSVPMRLFSRTIWGCDDDRDPMNEVLSLLPERFDGVLLDVPVGTGVFTAPLYRRYPEATIIGVDCSLNMLRKAKTHFREQGVNNVHLLKADAAHLPLGDAAADLVVSMNGWHAFADKRGAIAEMRRVLSSEGKLIACGYVTGVRRRSDWFVRRFGVRHGYFTPPFFRMDELPEQFEGFTIARKGCDQSIAWFEAAKQGA